MKHEFEWYWDRANELVERDKGLRDVQNAMDRMARLEYNLPKSLQNLEWMRTVKTTAPADAIDAGIKVLTGLAATVRIDPITVIKSLGDISLTSDVAKTKANEWETALKWQWELASRRRGTLYDDIIRSSLMYDEIVGQVVHLPSQIRSIEAMGGNANRYRAAQRNGQFAVLLKNPQTTHVRYSDYMAEAVLSASVMEAQAIVDFWGEKAKKLAKDIKDEEIAPDEAMILFDYADYESRCVWACPGESDESVEWDKKYVIMEPEENKLDFLPWVAICGGTNLASAPENQRFPLLWKVYQAETWLTANITGSLVMSQSIATAAQPQMTVEGPNPDAVEVDYTTPGGRVDVPPGHKVAQLTQQPLNPALREAYDRFVSDMARSTVPSVLVSAESTPGEAFSGYNLRIQQAVGALLRYRKTAERFHEAVCRQMLLWCEHSGEPIKGYGSYQIEPEDIDPKCIYLSVELTPDVPLDKQQKWNTAIMAHREMPISWDTIATDMGITDPKKEWDQWAKEQWYLAEVTGRAKLIQAEYDLQIQQAQMQMQMQAQQATMQMQQQAQMEQAQMMQQGQPNQQPAPGSPMGMPGAGGMGMDPNAGGQPPAGVNPSGNVMEQQTGQSRMGEEVI